VNKLHASAALKRLIFIMLLSILLDLLRPYRFTGDRITRFYFISVKNSVA